ncbi:thioredoxin peroxidase [Pichia kluyveri]|uniref:thioredoxin-dependent peroxiredoxin n=1 Tax=Pichia kluyveri TaxID=36015 RepID=A0AAV5R673_PICKL|nr:thioredoxin peroxidase [Pichia kluyveri]
MTVRRSTRIASQKEDLSVIADKKITSNARVSKPVADKKVTKVVKKTKPVVKTTPVVKKSKSRSAKKEDAIVVVDDDDKEDDKEKITIDDDEEEEEEDEEEEEIKELNEGDKIPESIEVELQDSTKINLSKYAKDNHILVIFAYPKASTPGCTKQAKGFRDEFDDLKKLNATVLGLSADNSKSQTSFKNKQELPYNLIADTKLQLITLLGCKKFPNKITRSHFIFVDGILKIKKIKISPEDSFKTALEDIKKLQ